MSRGHYMATATKADETGRLFALANVQVSVFHAGTMDLAPIYVSLTGGGQKSNPFITTQDGLMEFYADLGEYEISIDDLQDPPRIATKRYGWNALPEHGSTHNPGGSDEVDWDSASGSDAGAIQKVILDAKGDLLVASAADSVSRLAVGTDGHILTADSSQSLGVKWAAPPAAGDSSTTWINVRDYGVVGDGVTDDRAAIQALIDAHHQDSGAITAPNARTLYFPPGYVYAIGAPLHLRFGTRLRGDHTPSWLPPGARSPVIQARAGWTGNALFQIWENSVSGFSASQPTGGSIVGLVFDGADRAETGVYWRGVANDWTIENCEAYRCQIGFRSEGVGTNGNQELNFFHCHAQGNYHSGWYFGARSYDHRLVACVSHTNTDSAEGFWVDTLCSAIEFLGCRAEWNHANGFRFNSVDRITVADCRTDSNTANGILIHATSLNDGAIVISNFYASRDGSANVAGSRAAVRVLDTPSWVIIDGLNVRTGFNDGGGGINRPYLGMDVSNSPQLMFSGRAVGVNTNHTGVWREVGGTGNPAFANGWLNHASAGSTLETAAFRKSADGMVHLKGVIRSGTLGNPAFVLPVGYRPLRNLLIATDSDGSYARVTIGDGGGVSPSVGSTSGFSLDGISFFTS